MANSGASELNERGVSADLRDEVKLSDSALSKQLTTLEGTGYVEIRRGFVGKRPRTSARLTKTGRAATSPSCRKS